MPTSHKPIWERRTRSAEGEALEMAHLAAINLYETIRMAQYFEQEQYVEEGIRELTAVLSDVAVILESKERTAMDGRYPKLPRTAEEMVETLRVARDIEQIAIELHMKDKPGMTVEDEQAFLAKARRLMSALGMRARFTRDTIRQRWPEAWTLELEIEFKKILDIGRSI
jgi:hypothetical protein